MTVSWSIHVAANGVISFFLRAVIPFVCMYHIFFIHASASGRTGCFYVLATCVTVHVCFQIMFFFVLFLQELMDFWPS